MKRKLLATLLVGTLAVSMTACSSSDSNGDSNQTDTQQTEGESTDTSASGSYDAIRLVNGKPEVDTQLQALAAKYKEETGNEITIESIGGDTSAADALKGYYQAGNMPDIFVAETNQIGDYELADLSGEAWCDNTQYEYVDDEMGTVGFPYMVEATAIAYNADVLEAAGVDPASLTSPSAYEEAFATIDSKKDELGLTAVIGYCAEPNNLGWSTGTHIFAQYLDSGLAADDTTYIDLLNDGGQIDEARMTSFAKFIGLFNQYSDPALLVDGTYDNQVGNFAAGKYAFVTQGSWIGASLTANENYSGFAVGFAPYAFEDGMDTIIAGPSSYWTVYKDGNVEAAKAFLQWCSEDSAQNILVNDAGFISPFDNCQYEPSDPFAASVISYMQAGKTSGWHTFLKKSGLENRTCQVFADYAKGTLDESGFVTTIGQVIVDFYSE
ncbi:MAG: extracellular solute-binding protein [Butyrivibrio sp.]|uniref:ABC transporter substrate-binding protein n=1 Tax=Butyrivibrio sp. TaxID=28121 RepID=UPI0025F983CC|nr:extracellular solute-binding protein [Butyrivibrio sp.]MCR5773202.1 extracellular solute-binding protein [Butyrivibrio sp.]